MVLTKIIGVLLKRKALGKIYFKTPTYSSSTELYNACVDSLKNNLAKRYSSKCVLAANYEKEFPQFA